MPFQKLQFRPGIIRDLTGYTNEGGWRVSNLIRFRYGFPETVGGWAKYSPSQFLGTCRSMLNWVTVLGNNLLGMGTHLKYYIERGGEYNDITPIRSADVLTGPFAATNGSSVITVTDTAHGCTDGDFVTFSGATGLGGTVTATVLNLEYQITFINANSYSITVSVVANASDSGTGGTVTAAYQINTGLDTQVGGNGWSAGTWGRGGWSSATTLTAGNTLRLWSQDNYGEDLVFAVRNGGVYYWDASLGLTTRGVTLASLSTDSSTPTLAAQVMVSDRDRHVLAFGANQGGVTTQDPLTIRFSSQEDPYLWTPTATNTAGELRLGSGSTIVKAVETKREIVVFTDTSMYSLQFLGPPYTFGVQQISSNTSIMGYNSVAAVDDSIIWMGDSEFYVYSGKTDVLLCPLKEYVFDDFNFDERDKVFAGVNSEYNEVTWFYPSADVSENNRYVTFNYKEGVWTYGTLARTAWLDHGVRIYPQAASVDQYLYDQELGTDDGSTSPATPLNAFIESSPFDIAEGERFSLIRRIIPDVSFQNATNTPRLDLTLKSQDYPGSNYVTGPSAEVIQSSTVPVEQYTQVKDVRLRGRSVILRVESNRVGTCWRLGSPRLEIQVDGRR